MHAKLVPVADGELVLPQHAVHAEVPCPVPHHRAVARGLHPPRHLRSKILSAEEDAEGAAARTTLFQLPGGGSPSQ